MPLNKPPLTLEPDPRSVQAARRWILSILDALGRRDLEECAELGISELVTNALLHAEAPITVRVRGTRSHPRIEVSDGSRRPPELPNGHGSDLDSLLTTFGRGLDLVARCSVAWGTTIEPDGKVVWFEPGGAALESDPPVGRVVDDESEPAPPGDDDTYVVRLRQVSVPVLLSVQRHYRELRREVRLLSLAHPDTYPLATRLSDLFGRLERASPDDLAVAATEAEDEGRSVFDVDIHVKREVAELAGGMVELMSMADEFCRAQRLLALARTDEQRAFQEWLLGEVVRQADGAEPRPWAPGHEHTPGASGPGGRISKFVS